MKDLVCVLGIVLSLFAGIGGCVMRLQNTVYVAGQMAQREQLVSDLGRVDAASNEDVMGQVTEWNMNLRRCQAENDLWWLDLMIPDGWDEMEAIEIPVANRQ